VDDGGGRSGDVRLPIAAAGLLLLAVLVGALLLGGSSSGGTAVAPPPQCVSLWNENRRALVYGYHSFHSHRYTKAEVVRLDWAGNASRRGSCAVVFPSATLDPERRAAVKVYREGQWLALSKAGGVNAVRLAELQVEAVDGANVTLGPDGTLDPLS